MGSISRSERAERFIEEFNTDYPDKHRIRDECFTDQGLAYDDCTGVVVFVLTYQKGDIKVGLVHDDLHVVFDPEMDEFSEIESVANDLGMPIEEVQARFLKAGLVRKGGTLDA